MSASIDALAMAGVDYAEVAIDFNSVDDYIPPHLLAKNQGLMDENGAGNQGVKNENNARSQGVKDEKDGRNGVCFHCELKGDEETVKRNLVAWAKAVSSWARREFEK